MVKGVRELERKLLAIPPRVERMAKEAMEKGADELVAMMKRLVPVDAGDLRDSIGWTWGEAPEGSFVISQTPADSRGLKITVYAGSKEVYYATWVEFGTAPHNVADGGGAKGFQGESVEHPGSRATPFFFPSYRALRKRIRSRIKRQMLKAIRFVGPDIPG